MLNKNGKVSRSIILLVFCAAAIIILFHSLIFSGFNVLLGDRFDALIETNLLLHWFNVIQGKAEWDTVGYFYPFDNTLGYNDGYFLYGVIYSIFRLLGFDLFISTDLVNISLKVIGFYSFYYLTNRVLKFEFFASLSGATAFTLANSISVQMIHAQLLSVAFSPLLTFFILNYFKELKLNNTSRCIFNGVLASLLLALWLFTSYYMAWYFILFFVFSFAFFTLICLNEKGGASNLRLRFSIKSVLYPFLALILFLVPFLKVYLPKASETGGQTLSAVESYAPDIYNVIDPGQYNYMFGKLSDFFFKNVETLSRSGELNIGLAPVSIVILFIVTIFLLIRKNKSIVECLISAVCLATLVTALFAIKFGDIFLWKYIWQYFPGAKGMRVTARYFLFLIFPVTLASTYFLDRLARKKGGLLFYVLCFVLLLEQINFAPNATFNRAFSKSFVSSVHVPPQGCNAFYVVGQRKGEFPTVTENIILSFYPHNVDAMLISEVYNIRTINGFSTFNPPGWDFALNPKSTYLARVQNYISKNNISKGMCEFDLENMKWTEFKADQPIGITSRIYNKIDIKLLDVFIPSDSSKNYRASIRLTNQSEFDIGSGSYRPLKLGIKLYSADGKIINQDYMHLEIPHLSAGGGEKNMNIALPDDFQSDDYISISILEEGVAWFDWLGFQPLIVKF
ncbi:hypothetical protein [Pantoea dispersa]|uniref:hypothetical protein n=1 Tax=Pantoea dispersa TaxID=59814 RepID=UPI001EE6CADA|nr:hypothetical protein [Pantoea dispersa]UKY37919.1 hypothetical protein KFZ74_07555 [Pantoea dispersa]